MSKKHNCTPENAPKFLDWIANRGGVAIWDSINLSNLDASWSSPARDKDGSDYGRPNWQCDVVPTRIVTRAEDIEVCYDKEVKRFHVAIRRASNGMSLKVTDGGTRRIRAAVAKAGVGAYHVFDYETQEAVIMAPERTVPLNEWKP